MKTIIRPEKSSWECLCNRPSLQKSDLEEKVREILNRVKSEKDRAILDYSEKFDGVRPARLKVSEEEIIQSAVLIPDKIKKAIGTAQKNIEKFHSSQLSPEPMVETSAGVTCWRRSVAIEKAGLYIPGGSAPLFSTVLMLGIPAKLAGCREIILCSPAGKDGKINPLIIYTANLIGITDIFKTGGAQSIAAMAYGTESIPRVNKIFGPGNQYVTKAKELVQQEGVAIDMPAGPSEVLVIADAAADPEFIAADLLSQAEHGPDSQVIFLTTSTEMIEKVQSCLNNQLEILPRREIASKAMDNSRLILLSSLGECIEFSNLYAPEHLIINTSEPEILAERVINAGSVFLGPYSCESAGDYASGTNHTLPTNGYARSYSGVSTESFMKKISFQKLTAEGLTDLGPAIEIMAEAEMLNGHKNAVSIRLKSLSNDCD
jgi:histidinol dehydrogenase